MKLIGRIIIILLAALAVTGVTYAAGMSGVLSMVAGSGRGGPPPSVSGATVGQPPAGFQRGGSEAGGFSVSGLLEIGKDFGIIAVVVLIVASIVGLIQRRKRAQRKAHTNGPNAPV